MKLIKHGTLRNGGLMSERRNADARPGELRMHEKNMLYLRIPHRLMWCLWNMAQLEYPGFAGTLVGR
jgi:hypothetical protein